MTARTIGLVGGMSPESTAAYYQRIVRTHVAERHDHNYPRIVISSVSFQQYIDWQHAGAWELIADALTEEFVSVARAGASFGVLATNTMHKVLPQVRSPIPILHVIDAVALHARERGIASVALTGTSFTMSDGFYADALAAHGLRVILPGSATQEWIHHVIYDELIAGRVTSRSREEFNVVTDDLLRSGADVVLLACTELGMLVEEGDSRFVDTTAVHARAAWQTAIADRELPAA